MATTESVLPAAEDIPPPADHVIRPHHIAVLTILMMAFKDLDIKNFPREYSLHIQRVLLNEISEVCVVLLGSGFSSKIMCRLHGLNHTESCSLKYARVRRMTHLHVQISRSPSRKSWVPVNYSGFQFLTIRWIRCSILILRRWTKWGTFCQVGFHTTISIEILTEITDLPSLYPPKNSEVSAGIIQGCSQTETTI